MDQNTEEERQKLWHFRLGRSGTRTTRSKPEPALELEITATALRPRASGRASFAPTEIIALSQSPNFAQLTAAPVARRDILPRSSVPLN